MQFSVCIVSVHVSASSLLKDELATQAFGLHSSLSSHMHKSDAVWFCQQRVKFKSNEGIRMQVVL